MVQRQGVSSYKVLTVVRRECYTRLQEIEEHSQRSLMEERFIGLDVGTRRIGVAASSPGGMMVLPVETVDGRDQYQAAQRIVELIVEYDALAVVVGLPLDMRGREGR